MNFAYLRYVSQVGGTTAQIYRPVVPVDLAGPDGEVDFYGLVDTGSDDTIIPRIVAQELGLIINEQDTSQVRGIGDELITVASAEVELRVSDGVEYADWHAKVGVIGTEEDEGDFVILGHSGCLEFFTATFSGDNRILELSPNSRFDGSFGSLETGPTDPGHPSA